MSLGKLLALPELHFPHRSSEGLGQGKRVHLDEPCRVLSPDFPPPKSPGCRDDWHTLMSAETQILVPVLPSPGLTSSITRQNSHTPHHVHRSSGPCPPSPGLTSSITRQNSHTPHHVHRSSRACCGPHCWLLQAIMPPYSAALPPATPHTPPLPGNAEQIGSSLYAQRFHSIPILSGLCCIPSPSPPPSDEPLFILQGPEFISW